MGYYNTNSVKLFVASTIHHFRDQHQSYPNKIFMTKYKSNFYTWHVKHITGLGWSNYTLQQHWIHIVLTWMDGCMDVKKCSVL